MNYTIHLERFRKMGYGIPKLGTTLISIKHHTQYRGNYFHAEDNGYVIVFPETIISYTTKNKITVSLLPASNFNLP